MVKSSPAASPNARICAAVLRLVAAQGWGKLTLDSVAKAAKIPATTLKQTVKTVNGLVALIAEEIDRDAIAAAGKGSGSVHDRLFDLFMARFDILQTHRTAIDSMAAAARHDRRLQLALGRAALDSAYRFIDAAGLTEPFPPRPILAAGIVGIYGWGFCVWRKDTSRDMAKTMAAADRGLRWAEKAVNVARKYFTLPAKSL